MLEGVWSNLQCLPQPPPVPSPAAPPAAVLHAATRGRSRRLPEGCYRTRRAKAPLKNLYVDVSPFRNAAAESDEQGEGESTSLTP